MTLFAGELRAQCACGRPPAIAVARIGSLDPAAVWDDGREYEDCHRRIDVGPHGQQHVTAPQSPPSGTPPLIRPVASALLARQPGLPRLTEPLLQVVSVHYRDELHIGVQSREERLGERDHIGWVRHVEHDEPCPPPLEGAEVHRLRLPALPGSLEELTDGPVLDPWLPDSTGSMILAITRMTTPPLGATAPVRRSPLRMARQSILSLASTSKRASREPLPRRRIRTWHSTPDGTT